VCLLVPQAEKCFDSFAYYQSVMDFAGYHSINPDISKVRKNPIADMKYQIVFTVRI
jgi:hypothetical protein